jgi:hypothetical protein
LKKDIQIPKVEDVYVAVVYEYNDIYKTNDWNAYIINDKDVDLDMVIIVTTGSRCARMNLGFQARDRALKATDRSTRAAATESQWRRQLHQVRAAKAVPPSALMPLTALARTQSHPASQAIAAARMTRPRSRTSSGTNARSAIGTAPMK